MKQTMTRLNPRVNETPSMGAYDEGIAVIKHFTLTEEPWPEFWFLKVGKACNGFEL